jgi:hypothetical protein
LPRKKIKITITILIPSKSVLPTVCNELSIKKLRSYKGRILTPAGNSFSCNSVSFLVNPSRTHLGFRNDATK